MILVLVLHVVGVAFDSCAGPLPCAQLPRGMRPGRPIGQLVHGRNVRIEGVEIGAWWGRMRSSSIEWLGGANFIIRGVWVRKSHIILFIALVMTAFIMVALYCGRGLALLWLPVCFTLASVLLYCGSSFALLWLLWGPFRPFWDPC